MKVINREMKSQEDKTSQNIFLPYCQASINSDGCITLRNYNIESKDKDEILILSRSETDALIKLFCEVRQKFNLSNLPF